MRIDKLLSDMGLATRSEARAACKAGQITVDGVPVKDSSSHVDPGKRRIVFRGREISYRKYTYVMLNKGTSSAHTQLTFSGLAELDFLGNATDTSTAAQSGASGACRDSSPVDAGA